MYQIPRSVSRQKPKESTHACKFLGRLIRSEPTATGGVAVRLCREMRQYWCPRPQLLFFFGCRRRSRIRVYKFFSRETLDLCTTDNRP